MNEIENEEMNAASPSEEMLGVENEPAPQNSDQIVGEPVDSAEIDNADTDQEIDAESSELPDSEEIEVSEQSTPESEDAVEADFSQDEKAQEEEVEPDIEDETISLPEQAVSDEQVEIEVASEDADIPEADEDVPPQKDLEEELLHADSVEEVESEADSSEAEGLDQDPSIGPSDAREDEPVVDTEEVAPVAEPDDGRLWYVVHCYSGYENKVRHNLEQRIESMGMKGKIFDVVVPTEEEMEVKDGKRRTVERRVFPGYILVQMLMDEDSWYVVRNTPGVTGFVGMGNDPTPLRPEEVQQIIKRMEAEAPRIKVTYSIGQKVRIIDGPFNDFIGTVDDIDMDRAKVRVMVSFFGRETPVELDFLQVEKA